MKLPNDSIGVTDLRSYRECPRRFEFGMRRHGPLGEHPEATTPANVYGSAIHEAIAYAEAHGATDQEAVQHAFNQYAAWLDVEHLIRMKTDMETYRARDYTGVTAVAVEKEVRVPLFTHKGQQIYFRCKLDRVYQRKDNPGVFIHVDYKSSGHPLTDAEIHADVQMWAYNWVIHEYWPECDTLIQVYDQLQFGAVPTRKSEEQRNAIKEWLIVEATAVIEDDELRPKINDWCGWCAIAESCPAVKQATEWTEARIKALGPTDEQNIDEYVELMTDVAQARKLLERFENSVRDTLKKMPDHRRQMLGYEVRERNVTYWPPEAIRAMHEMLGDGLYDLVGLTKTAVESKLDPNDAAAVMQMAETRKGAPFLKKVKSQ